MSLAKIEDGALVIRMDAAALAAATEACPRLEFCDAGKNDFLITVTVTDREKWMRSVCHQLNDESEDGTTLVRTMFDAAFDAACNAGEEGIEIEAPHPVPADEQQTPICREAAMTKKEVKAKSLHYAGGRPSAEALHIGATPPEMRERWFPRLRGSLVRNSDDPADGFDTRELAVAAAEKFRANCAAWAASH